MSKRWYFLVATSGKGRGLDKSSAFRCDQLCTDSERDDAARTALALAQKRAPVVIHDAPRASVRIPGAISQPRTDRDRLALRFEWFKAVACVVLRRMATLAHLRGYPRHCVDDGSSACRISAGNARPTSGSAKGWARRPADFLVGKSRLGLPGVAQPQDDTGFRPRGWLLAKC
jgi:hypothetical protein